MIASAQVFDSIVRERRSVRIYDQEKDFDSTSVLRSIERALLSPNSSNMQMWEFYRVMDVEKIKAIAPFCMNQNAAKTARELLIITIPKHKWKNRAQANYQFHLARYGKKNLENLSSREKRKLKYYTHLMPLYYFQDWFGIAGMIRKLIVFFASFWRPVVWQVSKNELRMVCHKSAALAAQTFMLSMQAEGFDTCPMEGFDSKKVKKYLGLSSGYEINMIISCGDGKPEGIYHERFRVPFSETVFTV